MSDLAEQLIEAGHSVARWAEEVDALVVAWRAFALKGYAPVEQRQRGNELAGLIENELSVLDDIADGGVGDEFMMDALNSVREKLIELQRRLDDVLSSVPHSLH